MKEAESDKGI